MAVVVEGARGKPDKSILAGNRACYQLWPADMKALLKDRREFVKIHKSLGGRVENTKPRHEPWMRRVDTTLAPLSIAAWNMAGNQSNTRPQILVFILPDKDSIIYGRIKRSAECRYGVVSQCMQFAHVQVPGTVHLERLHEICCKARWHDLPLCWF